MTLCSVGGNSAILSLINITWNKLKTTTISPEYRPKVNVYGFMWLTLNNQKYYGLLTLLPNGTFDLVYMPEYPGSSGQEPDGNTSVLGSITYLI